MTEGPPDGFRTPPTGEDPVPSPGPEGAPRRRTTRPHPLLGRPPLRAGIVILPSAFTLGNLFFGTYALVAAARGDLIWAAWFVVSAAFLDFADGRVARFTRTGTSFGAALDSLVDAVSFGVAPGFILYQLFLKDSAWGWLLSFAFVTATVLRLARFNVEQAGKAKTHFHGLPSPTAGMILATYPPFSETPFFQSHLSHLPWPQILVLLTVVLCVLMVSHIPYAAVPRLGGGSAKGAAQTGVFFALVLAALLFPRYTFFPLLLAYTFWGLAKSLLLGLWERLPERDPLLEDEEETAEDAGGEVRPLDYREVVPGGIVGRWKRVYGPRRAEGGRPRRGPSEGR